MNAIDAINHYAQRGERVDGVLQHIVTNEIERLREALKFYADTVTYEPFPALIHGVMTEIYPIDGDEGEEARKALAGESD